MVKFCVIFIVLLVPSVSKYLQGTLCYLTLMEMGEGVMMQILQLLLQLLSAEQFILLFTSIITFNIYHSAMK